MTYDRAVAWVIARLAEALDHAAGRGVTHGDVKPSNILLSADGNPMLLDFNLARDDAPAVDRSGRPIDPGGTLAYMAPERLRALARACQSADSIELDDHPESPGPVERAAPAGQAAHVADVYALGTVLLETLSGRPPFQVPAPDSRGTGPSARPARLMFNGGCLCLGPRAPGSGDRPRLRGGLGPADRAGPARSSSVASTPTRPAATVAPWSWPRTSTAGGPTGRWPTPTSRSGARPSPAGSAPGGGCWPSRPSGCWAPA